MRLLGILKKAAQRKQIYTVHQEHQIFEIYGRECAHTQSIEYDCSVWS